MAFAHRRVIYSDTDTEQTCLFYCQPQQSFCSPACLQLCPSSCKYSGSGDSPSPPNTPPHRKNLSPLLISMLTVLASAFLLFALYLLFTKLSNRRTITNPRSRTGENHAPSVIFHPTWLIPTVGLTPSVINAIAVVTYAKEEKSGATGIADCAVCLAEFEEGEELRVLPTCNHAFHVTCVDTWLRSHTNCPLCRAPIVVDRTAQNSPGELRINVEETNEEDMENKELGKIIENNKGSGSSSSSSSSSSQRLGVGERGCC